VDIKMITIYDWFGYELTIKERYRLIKEAGFDGVLLWWSNGFGRDVLGRNDYRNGPQIVRKAGLFIENIHAPVENQNDLWLDNLYGEAVFDCYLHCVIDCASLKFRRW
jgi:endo-alpha-1,4-polygalactosaminidase (GH114 family)